MASNSTGRTDKVGLVFFKNAIGEFVYSCPVYVNLEKGYKNSYYKILKGLRKGQIIGLDSCVTAPGILSKLTGKGGSVSLKSVSKFDSNNCLTILLDEELEKHIYNLLREKKGQEPPNDVFLYALLGYGDKIGRAISSVEKKTLGGLSVEVKGGFDDSFENLNSDAIALAYNDSKPKQAVAEAGAGQKSQISSQKSQVAIKTNIPNSKKTTSEQNVSTSGVNTNSTTDTSVSSKKNDSKDSNNQNNDSNSNGRVDVVGIKEKLRKKIISQDRAIDDVVNNIYFNQRYIDSGDRDLLRNKANIILDGSTGTGKTFILEEVANELKLPICVTGITNYSTVGYRGDSLTDILYKLLDKADGNLELAERGIVALDEFDKLGGFADNDVSMRRALQQELLTFISGTSLNVEYNGQTYNFDTSKLTFIAMGAFTNLRERKIKENEKKYKSGIGFSSTSEEDIERKYTITKDDYVSEGLERELVGRFSCLTYTRDLSIEDLERILTESITSPLNGLKITGNIMGCDIVVTPEIIHEIAERAFETNTGARGLIQIVQSLKDVVANDLFSGKKELIITKEHLDKTNNVHEREYQARKGY